MLNYGVQLEERLHSSKEEEIGREATLHHGEKM